MNKFETEILVKPYDIELRLIYSDWLRDNDPSKLDLQLEIIKLMNMPNNMSSLSLIIKLLRSIRIITKASTEPIYSSAAINFARLILCMQDGWISSIATKKPTKKIGKGISLLLINYANIVSCNAISSLMIFDYGKKNKTYSVFDILDDGNCRTSNIEYWMSGKNEVCDLSLLVKVIEYLKLRLSYLYECIQNGNLTNLMTHR